MAKHIHRMRPIWLLLTAPADVHGWQRIVTYARCSVCGVCAVLAGEQHPNALASRVVEDGT